MPFTKDADGRIINTVAPRLGTEAVFITHKLDDPTTWFGNSVRVTDEAATDSGDGLTWNLANTDVINLREGLVRDEDGVSQDDIDNGGGHGYLVVVKVDTVEQTQDDPFTSGTQDYGVDYAAGTITFASTQAGKTVEVSYSYANGSDWKMVPAAGTMLDIEDAEAQFAADTVFADTAVFEIVAPVDKYPALAPYWDQHDPPGPYPAGTKLPLKTVKYKRLGQVLDEAKGSYPTIPAMGGAARGFTQDIYGFPFRYGTIRRLYSTYGMELHVRLEGDTKFGGSHSTVTFYCLSQTEALPT